MPRLAFLVLIFLNFLLYGKKKYIRKQQENIKNTYKLENDFISLSKKVTLRKDNSQNRKI